MAELLYRIGRIAASRRLAVLATWVAVLAVAAGAFVAFGKAPSSDISIPGTPTAVVTEHLAASMPGVAGANGTVVFSTRDGSPFTDAQKAAVAEAVGRAAKVEGVTRVVDPFVTQAEGEARARQVADGRAQIEAAKAQLADGQKQLDASKAQLTDGQKQLDAGKAQLTDGQKQLDAGKAQLDAQQQQLDAAKAAPAVTAATLAQLDAQQQRLDAAKAQLAAKQQQADAGAATIAAKQQEIDDGLATIASKQQEIDAGAATIVAQSTKLEAGATLMELASKIRLVSVDGSTAVAAVMFAGTSLSVPQELKTAVKAAFLTPAIDGVDVNFSSGIAQGIPNLVGVGEMAGLVIAAIVLLLIVRTVIGASLPILTALLGVAIGALGALSLAGVVDMVSVTPILGVMLGLAVGIDYALFIINRHRRQLRDGYTVSESIALANGTSGNAVLFAGSTVIIALLALNVTGIPFLGLMGTVGAASVTIAVLIAITLTPALLSLVGMRILRGSERAHLTDQVGPAPVAAARPISTPKAIALALVGIAALVVIAIPSASLRLGLPLGSADNPDTTQHKAYDLIGERFGDGANGPLLVVADLPAGTTEEQLLDAQVAVAQRLAGFDDVAAVAPVGASADRTVTAFQVLPAEGPSSVSTEQLVKALRAASPLEGGVAIGVAGQTTGNIDISQKLADALPFYLLVVVGLSLVIMIVVFRSLFVPIVATGGFVLSFFAALGGVVAIYQWGWFGGLFGVATPAPILNFLPTILVGILFGLAMDYTLFVASGMREAYVHGAPAKVAVVLGVRAGRAVVMAAAIIMAAVFGGFVLSDSAIIRPIGFALAFGVLVDAFLVRLLIMPALMTLAGDWAWWLPRWLDRLIPNVDVEGATLERRHPHVAADHLEPT
ncbi:MAG: MMPL family transporter [Candidatus Limnocylindrales bacterium]